MLNILAEINAPCKQVLGNAPLQHAEQQVNYRSLNLWVAVRLMVILMAKIIFWIYH